MSLPSDPKIVGPGLWFAIHTTAFNARSEEGKKTFVKFMDDINKNMKCTHCRDHSNTFIKQNPIENYWYVTYNNVDVGMFQWSYIYHNAVNAKLNKPIMTWETAYNLYANAGVSFCTNTCATADMNTTPTIAIAVKGPVPMFTSRKR